MTISKLCSWPWFWLPSKGGNRERQKELGWGRKTRVGQEREKETDEDKRRKEIN